MIFGRLFRRATTPPLPSLAEALLAPLAAAGLTGVVVQGDAPEREAGIRKGVVGRGLVEITAGGPPDFVQVTSEGGGGGHLARTAAVGFHFLVRRDGLAASVAAGWGSQGKIVARREFGGVGMARDFHWEAVMEDSDVAAAAGGRGGRAAERRRRLDGCDAAGGDPGAAAGAQHADAGAGAGAVLRRRRRGPDRCHGRA